MIRQIIVSQLGAGKRIRIVEHGILHVGVCGRRRRGAVVRRSERVAAFCRDAAV